MTMQLDHIDDALLCQPRDERHLCIGEHADAADARIQQPAQRTSCFDMDMPLAFRHKDKTDIIRKQRVGTAYGLSGAQAAQLDLH